MFGYFLPAFFARFLAADFCLEVSVFDFFFGFFFSQIGLLAILLLYCKRLRSSRVLCAGMKLPVGHLVLWASVLLALQKILCHQRFGFGFGFGFLGFFAEFMGFFLP